MGRIAIINKRHHFTFSEAQALLFWVFCVQRKTKEIRNRQTGPLGFPIRFGFWDGARLHFYDVRKLELSRWLENILYYVCYSKHYLSKEATLLRITISDRFQDKFYKLSIDILKIPDSIQGTLNIRHQKVEGRRSHERRKCTVLLLLFSILHFSIKNNDVERWVRS